MADSSQGNQDGSDQGVIGPADWLRRSERVAVNNIAKLDSTGIDKTVKDDGNDAAGTSATAGASGRKRKTSGETNNKPTKKSKTTSTELAQGKKKLGEPKRISAKKQQSTTKATKANPKASRREVSSGRSTRSNKKSEAVVSNSDDEPEEDISRPQGEADVEEDVLPEAEADTTTKDEVSGSPPETNPDDSTQVMTDVVQVAAISSSQDQDQDLPHPELSPPEDDPLGVHSDVEIPPDVHSPPEDDPPGVHSDVEIPPDVQPMQDSTTAMEAEEMDMTPDGADAILATDTTSQQTPPEIAVSVTREDEQETLATNFANEPRSHRERKRKAPDRSSMVETPADIVYEDNDEIDVDVHQDEFGDVLGEADDDDYSESVPPKRRKPAGKRDATKRQETKDITESDVAAAPIGEAEEQSQDTADQPRRKPRKRPITQRKSTNTMSSKISGPLAENGSKTSKTATRGPKTQSKFNFGLVSPASSPPDATDETVVAAESDLDPVAVALSDKMSYRQPLAMKPLPQGQPLVWADSRQALCETVPYFRMPQSGCHQNDRHVYAFMFDGIGHVREYMDSNVIIARAGGGMEPDSSGQLVQKKDHLMSESQVQSVMNDIEHQNPLVIICGNKNEGTLAKMPHRYNVLGWYKPIEVWGEKTLGKGKKLWTTIKYRFERLDATNEPWHAPSDQLLTEEEQQGVGPVIRKPCNACQKHYAMVYLVGWMCLNPECEMFWKLEDGQDAPCGKLHYNPAFLLSRTPWASEEQPYSVRPPVPDVGNVVGDNLTHINTRGICCPECGRCSSRRLFTGWMCDNPHCNYQNFPKHIPIKVPMIHQPWESTGEGPTLARNKLEKAQGVNVSVTHKLGFKIYTYTFEGVDGKFVHAVSNAKINRQAGGPDEMFTAMQNQDDPEMNLHLERRRFAIERGSGSKVDVPAQTPARRKTVPDARRTTYPMFQSQVGDDAQRRKTVQEPVTALDSEPAALLPPPPPDQQKMGEVVDTSVAENQALVPDQQVIVEASMSESQPPNVLDAPAAPLQPEELQVAQPPIPNQPFLDETVDMRMAEGQAPGLPQEDSTTLLPSPATTSPGLSSQQPGIDLTGQTLPPEFLAEVADNAQQALPVPKASPNDPPKKPEFEDGDFMTAFSMNYGMPYKFVASGSSLPFTNAPWPVRACRGDLNWASQNFLDPEGHQDLNEELIFAYMEGQKIEYHDDGESGLGPRIGTLSLGGKAQMHLRLKMKHYVGCSKTGIFTPERPVPGSIDGPEMYEKRLAAWEELELLKSTNKQAYEKRRKELPKELGLYEKRSKKAQDLVTVTLNHGDIVLMEGYDIQKYLEHKVAPEGCLRFALTCRTVLPGHLRPEERPAYEVEEDDQAMSSLRRAAEAEQMTLG